MKSFRWTDHEVRAALRLPMDNADEESTYSGVSTDTRSLAPDALFVALAGPNFDAHNYLGDAAKAGATGMVVSRLPGNAPRGIRYYEVPSTLEALGRLARHRRDRLAMRVVGIVGSNGKTTTKDLVGAALAPTFRVHVTAGNLNNQIGVPLTLLGTPEDAEAVVVEMGTNEPGEIEILTEIVRPDAAIVTSIGEEHLEKLVDLEGVLREETAILAGLRSGAPSFVAEEPAALVSRARELRGDAPIGIAGFSPGANLRPEGGADGISYLPDGSTRWSWEGHEVTLPLPGRHNVRNALLALGLAREWGVDPAAAMAGIARVPSPKLRGEWRRIGDMRVLADCYNSNPPGVLAALDLLASVPSEGAKVAVLGTMRELGSQSTSIHERVATTVLEHLRHGLDSVIATGDFAKAMHGSEKEFGDRLILNPDPVAAYGQVSGKFRGNETVLLKASRGEALERWLPLLERDFENNSKFKIQNS